MYAKITKVRMNDKTYKAKYLRGTFSVTFYPFFFLQGQIISVYIYIYFLYLGHVVTCSTWPVSVSFRLIDKEMYPNPKTERLKNRHRLYTNVVVVDRGMGSRALLIGTRKRYRHGRQDKVSTICGRMLRTGCPWMIY